ncbi:LANO_0E06436g1_1 [Lachancea nothofagi CBS 11611]|uniref:LANO_0E06436g1_1 n=1 Tax=Lachancea nothofagi CBS 11611 TaxID=1266666 RepID=A0A1G4JTT7_9SACH|nr:LANO_0E06436g1_1 [Lachancea nothofagi CBS 11611]
MVSSFALQSNSKILNQSHIITKEPLQFKGGESFNKDSLEVSIASKPVALSDVRSIYQKGNFSTPGNYEIIQILGKGSYGVVVSAIDKRGDSKPCRLAIKKVTNIFHREILLKRAIRELKFLSFFRGHKNIVSLVDLEIVSEKPYDGLYCYQELVDYDLARVIHSTVQFSEFHIKHFLYQILCGLKYIHSADVIHRDLKPGNILCSISGHLKICDFGLARGISPLFAENKAGEIHITNYVATRWYRAPELILSHKRYNKSIDIWAVGCILAEFYGRKPLFMGQDSLHQVSEILKVLGTPSRSTIAKYCSARSYEVFSSRTEVKKLSWASVYSSACVEAQNLLDSLLDWDPDKRLEVDQILSHPFVSDVRNSADEPSCQGPFDYSYEHKFTSMQKLRDTIYEEVRTFKGIGSSSLSVRAEC